MTENLGPSLSKIPEKREKGEWTTEDTEEHRKKARENEEVRQDMLCPDHLCSFCSSSSLCSSVSSVVHSCWQFAIRSAVAEEKAREKRNFAEASQCRASGSE
jgi:hypothetical protein